ncbi:HK97 gp10 family phage protein [Hoeflea sp. 108]|uniref:HK97 gp10 family phage protein n=1 Tax=Hoeflea sp. 108 TaxID=1116369 RepID=UPI000377FE25|nr:HK97 gp10 family phage protein [Hoeflea sp. 108]
MLVKQAAQELVSQLNQLAPVDTGFLRASLMAPTDAMPTLSRANPSVAVPADLGDVILVINGADLGDMIYLGCSPVGVGTFESDRFGFVDLVDWVLRLEVQAIQGAGDVTTLQTLKNPAQDALRPDILNRLHEGSTQ